MHIIQKEGVWVKRIICNSPTTIAADLYKKWFEIYIKNDLQNFAFKISLTSLINFRLIDQLASRGSIPPMAILIELYLDWNVCSVSKIQSAMSLRESVNKLFVPHKITTFLRLDMTGKFWARHKTFWILSPPIPQFKVFRGSRSKHLAICLAQLLSSLRLLLF